MESTNKPSRLVRFAVVFTCLAVFVGPSGCVFRGGFAWSPDGTRGAFAAESQSDDGAPAGRVYDAAGKVLADLGPTTSYFTWSADGADLYFLRWAKGSSDATADRRWVGPAAPTTAPTTAPATGPATRPTLGGYATVCRLHDGKVEPIAPVGDRRTMGIAASPDGQWVVVTGVAATPAAGLKANDPIDLNAVAVERATGRAFVLADHSGEAVCFTGPRRAAFIDTSGNASQVGMNGPLVEVTLDAAGPLRRTTICDGHCPGWSSLAAAADGSVFFERDAAGGAFGSLCRWDRSTGRTAVLVGGCLARVFVLSPDGRRIALYEWGGDDVPPNTPLGGGYEAFVSLVLRDVDGRNRHVLRGGLNAKRPVPLPPTWHGNDHLTLAAETGEPVAAHDGRSVGRAYDIVDYQIGADGTLAADRVLSRDWPVADKPQTTDESGRR